MEPIGLVTQGRIAGDAVAGQLVMRLWGVWVCVSAARQASWGRVS